MFDKLALVMLVLIFAYCELVNLASIIPHLPNRPPQLLNIEHPRPQIGMPPHLSISPTTTTLNQASTIGSITSSATTLSVPTQQSTAMPTSVSTSTATVDPNADPEDPTLAPTQSPNEPNSNNGSSTPSMLPNPNKPSLRPTDSTNTNQPNEHHMQSSSKTKENNLEWSVLFYSIFIVYVSFAKLIYHNIYWIKHNMTEPGILMLFGILWELIARQISSNYDVFPRFNSRIFFYLFLPSTVLESASLLSNKWLFFNLLPILTHSIIGTILYAVSFGYTIYTMGQADLFAISHQDDTVGSTYNSSISPTLVTYDKKEQISTVSPLQQNENSILGESAIQLTDRPFPMTLAYHNITLTDCFIFGTILASIDAAPMLNVFKYYEVNEKLYYLVLGENLMNNAVVIILFNLFLEYVETTKLTVVKVYFAILQFFVNLIGGVLIGLILAAFTLICVRLTRRFQVPDALSSYQNQCQAMVETLLILKLAYLTYTLANLAGTSSIVSLATFGILNDQYIKQNLNLRSQLTFRQVILATKTMGFSLVYPLLGMMLVEVASSGRLYTRPMTATATGTVSIVSSQLWQSTSGSAFLTRDERASNVFERPTTASSYATDQLASLAQQTTQNWNFIFLCTVAILSISYRFVIVIFLGIIGNLLTCGQSKIKLREQILMAYGGLKGPLSVALSFKFLEHEDHHHRLAHNKHLFIYTITSITLVSTALVGSFIRPIVARVQATLVSHSSTIRRTVVNSSRGTNSPLQLNHGGRDTQLGKSNLSIDADRRPTKLFDQVNHKLIEYVSHGLNSILGHSKSPYDKFAEFNETHIKPWLARNDSNTNWLSVFYDNLVLDETLNANCFYVATEDPTTLRTLFNTSQQFEHLNLDNNFNHVVNSSSKVSQQRLNAGERNFSAILSKIQGQDYSKTLLREFVLLNLKMENSRRRRQQMLQPAPNQVMSAVGVKKSFNYSNDDEPRELSRRGTFMSSTSSSLLQQTIGRPRNHSRESKQKHLNNIIVQLGAESPKIESGHLAGRSAASTRRTLPKPITMPRNESHKKGVQKLKRKRRPTKLSKDEQNSED